MSSQPRKQSRAGSRTSRLIGVPAALLLLVWLDSWIGTKLAPSDSNQFAWAIWFMICIPLAVWLAFCQVSWTAAFFAGLFRSLEKAIVMAICWWQEALHPPKRLPQDYQPETLLAALSHANVWRDVFLPELCLFLSTYWMGLWLLDMVHTELINEPQQAYDARVDRISRSIAAIAPILAFLGAVLAAVIGKK